VCVYALKPLPFLPVGLRGNTLTCLQNKTKKNTHKQVDRDNFPAALAALRAALAPPASPSSAPSPAFVALDLEMTGTAPPPGCGAPPPAW
jgi:hypothetical protein